MDKKTDTADKIILPQNLQREMMRFFLKTSVPKIVEADRKQQQPSPKSNQAKE